MVDGGSTDRTAAIADQAGRQLCRCVPGGGATNCWRVPRRARFPWLLFLHADTVLEPGWEREASSFIEAVDAGRRPLAAAAFRFALDDVGMQAAAAGAAGGAAVRSLRLPYGDQGLLMPKRLYERSAATEPSPLMEDVDLVRRLGRRRIVMLRARAVTSAAALPARGLRAPLRAQSRLPDALFLRVRDARHRPPVRVICVALQHQLSVRTDRPSSP